MSDKGVRATVTATQVVAAASVIPLHSSSAKTIRVSAAVTTIAASASVTVHGAGLAVQQSVPAAALQYVYILLSAVLDPIGRNPVVNEYQFVADSTRLGVAKAFYEVKSTNDTDVHMVFNKGKTESLLTVETRTFAMSKSFFEALHATDDFYGNANVDDDQIMVFSKALSVEQQRVSDSSSSSFGKRLTEAKTATDQINSVVFGKAISDAGHLADVRTFALSKSFAEQLHAGDEFNAVALTDDGEVMVFGKNLSDIVSQADAVSLQPQKNFADQGATSDQINSFDVGKILTETPITSEATALGVSKPFTDAWQMSDSKAIGLSRGIPDRTYYPADGPNQYDTYAPTYFASDYVREGFPALAFGKQLNDSVQSTDDFYGVANSDDDETMQFGKTLTDSSSTSESKSFAVGRAVADTFGKSDSTTSSVGKALADSFTKSDTATKAAGKSLLDSSMTSDIVIQTTGKGLSDTSTTSDNKTFALSKSLLDSVHPTDDFLGVANPDDDETMAFGKVVSDSFTKSDSAALTPGKGLTDSVSKSDSGTLVWTDYWDINYTVTTSGVYVGNSKTF